MYRCPHVREGCLPIITLLDLCQPFYGYFFAEHKRATGSCYIHFCTCMNYIYPLIPEEYNLLIIKERSLTVVPHQNPKFNLFYLNVCKLSKCK